MPASDRELSPGWVETYGAVGLINELASKATDYEGARKMLMASLGGIPIGRRLDLAKSPNSWRFSRHHVRRPSREPSM
jgi:hypothetical protein